MKEVLLEEKYILEYIRDMMHDMKRKNVFIEDAKYHHNASYFDAISICKHGILTMLDLKRLNIKEYTKETLKKMNDITSHINGNDGVSLSLVGLKDLYRDEDEYDPFTPTQVDFLVSSDIQASRTSIHYGNEFLSYKSIEVNKLKAVDNLSLKVYKGQIYAFLGVNGAGKSTTISMICGNLKKDSGEIYVCGKDTEKESNYIKRQIGIVFQDSVLDKSLTVYDNLKYRAGLYGITGAEFKEDYEKLEKLFV